MPTELDPIPSCLLVCPVATTDTCGELAWLSCPKFIQLVLLEQGDIQSVCESSVYDLERGDVILIPPGKFHMSLLKTERTCYRRHVFYLYPSAFDAIGHPALCDFLERNENGGILSADSAETKQALLSCV